MSDSKKLSDPEVCESFAEFFDEKVAQLSMGLVDKTVELVPDSKPIVITMKILEEAVARTKPKKSSGPDGVPMMVMKDVFPAYKNEYLALFNRIIDEGKIPCVWK